MKTLEYLREIETLAWSLNTGTLMQNWGRKFRIQTLVRKAIEEIEGTSHLTDHEIVRLRRAQACNRDNLESLQDAIAGLQSTDDPSLVPLHDELMERYIQLKAEKEKKNDE